MARRAGLDALGNDDLVGDRKQLHGRHAATAVRIVATVLAIWIPTTGLAAAATVDPFVGTGGHAPWFSGNTTPAAARPFGMVQLGPDTTSDAETGAPSGTASGYSATDPLLRGFSATHLSGAGCRTLGDVPILPVVGRGAAETRVRRRCRSTRRPSEPTRVGTPPASRTASCARLAADTRAGLIDLDYPARARCPTADQGVRQPGRHLQQPGPVPERPRGRGARDERRLLRRV